VHARTDQKPASTDDNRLALGKLNAGALRGELPDILHSRYRALGVWLSVI